VFVDRDADGETLPSIRFGGLIEKPSIKPFRLNKRFWWQEIILL
jgi:hypothetical protein